jgi:FMN reductase
MASSVRVAGLGGSLREGSTSLTALQTALAGAAAAGAQSSVIRVRDLDLPMYSPERATPASARVFADTVSASDAMVWSTPTYHGSVSGSFKNALDWLILLAERDPPFLTNKPIGLVSTAGGVQGLQSVNSMDFMVRALRGWSVPLVLPVARSWQAFDPDGRLTDEMVAKQLRELGAEVVRAARQFQAEGTCDYSDEAQFSTGEAGMPAATAGGGH